MWRYDKKRSVNLHASFCDAWVMLVIGGGGWLGGSQPARAEINA